MRKAHIRHCIMIFFAASYNVLCALPMDSLKCQPRLLILPRFNTSGMAPVSGTIINTNPNIDLTLSYQFNRLTLNLASAIDLEDIHSELNYFLVNARYKLSLTRQFSVSPFLAFYSEHKQKLFDVGSDANAGMIFSWNHNFLSVEAFALFVRITHQKPAKDAINRLEVKYKFRYTTVSGFVFHNARYFDSRERICVGFKIAMPEFPILNNLNARTEITGSFKAYEYPETASRSAVFLSLVFPMTL